MPRFIIPLRKVNSNEAVQVGKVFANLGNFNNIGENLPNGFLISFEGFDKTVNPHFKELSSLLSPVKFNSADPEFLENLKRLTLERLELPTTLTTEIITELKELNGPIHIQTLIKLSNDKEILLDTPLITEKRNWEKFVKFSFLSFLNSQVLKQIKEVDALDQTLVSVLVTQKSHAEVSGTANIQEPKKNTVEINAFWGEPWEDIKTDKITIEPNTLIIKEYKVASQEQQLIWNNNNFQLIPVAKSFQNQKKLSTDQVLKITHALKRLQSHLLGSLNVNFQISNSKIYFTKVTAAEDTPLLEQPFSINLPVIQTLKPLYPGITTGVVKYINKVSDFSKIRRGEIAVITNFKKENLRFLRKASGVIVKNAASFQENNAQVIKQLGVSMAIGDLNSYLEGVVTLDGKSGKIYKGSFFPLFEKILEPKKPTALASKPVVTATKVFSSSSDTNKIINSKSEDFDGIGPVRAELLITKTGKHPVKLLEMDKRETLKKSLVNELTQVCLKATDKPVIYQAVDLKSSELIGLHAGAALERKEPNPLMGTRGAERALQNKELLELEFKVLKELRNKNGFKNLSLSFPLGSFGRRFVSTKKRRSISLPII